MAYILVKRNQPEKFIELRRAQGSTPGEAAGSFWHVVEHGFSIELYIHMLVYILKKHICQIIYLKGT